MNAGSDEGHLSPGSTDLLRGLAQGGEPGSPAPVLDGKYRLESRLGEGAVGSVFRAVHLDLQKTFALKVLKPAGALGPRAMARFRQEAEALGRLQHPHIVEVTDFGIDDTTGTAYLVMEHLAGRSLADHLATQGPFPLARALPLLAEIAEAVDAAHAAGILHRDLKPANVFLIPGRPEEVKIVDFGLAELVGPWKRLRQAREEEAAAGAPASLTATGALPGTPLYVAPEVIAHGETSRASDIYSLGVLAYELLAGRPPFEGTAVEVLAGHLRERPPSIAGLPREVERALFDLLQKDPARRPASARLAVRRLWAAAERAVLAGFRTTEIPRRLKLAAALAGLLAIVGALLPDPPSPILERWFYDLEVRSAAARPPDPRLLLVTLDEASLAASPAPPNDPAWADELGRVVPRLLAAGALGVAVDLLPPKAWSTSDPLADAILWHADALTLAAHSDPEERRVLGPECLSPLVVTALGNERAAALFGFTNLDLDADGTVRQGRLSYPLEDGSSRPSWAALAARHLGNPFQSAEGGSERFLIDHRIDWRRSERISWRSLPAVLARRPQALAGRLILIGGGALAASRDDHYVPGPKGRRERIPGLALQSLMISSLVAERPLRQAPGGVVAVAFALAVGLGIAGFLSSRRPAAGAVVLAALPVAYGAAAFACYHWVSLLLPVSAPLALAALGLVLAVGVRRALPPFPSGSWR